MEALVRLVTKPHQSVTGVAVGEDSM
jgi:hypothetical protein